MRALRWVRRQYDEGVSMEVAAAIAVGLAAVLVIVSFARTPQAAGWPWIGLINVAVLGWCWCAYLDTRDGGTSTQVHGVWFAFVSFTTIGMYLFARRAVGVPGHPRAALLVLLALEPVLLVALSFADVPWWERQFTLDAGFGGGRGVGYLVHGVFNIALIVLAAAMLGRRADYSRGLLRWSLYGIIAAAVLGVALQAVGADLMQWSALATGLSVHFAYAELSRDPYAAVDPVEIDALTGVLNRAGLERLLIGAVERAERYGEALALMLIDIDKFKSFNDTRGHLAGDTVLTTTARRLAGLVGRGGSVARFGGDEFVIFVTGLDVAHAVSFAMQTVAAASEPIDAPGGPLRPTVSVGVATYHGGTATDLIARADEAMYDAKARGGDTLAVRA
ncbi:sensor domain-containing diguanylate cyclase [Nocardioides sp. Kera G14]|uniref:GGDEF domain-containing protein n=1 Tax=Nocardioides sp. Kera G14 TaxID=2884264 RepID=UPI001D0F591F|nr:GGDEF domain-containing protein [Nocardioides sp. Kera G14]UDY22919.1 GGDEF domain-containing protein [Nocardioides sp. Kera G14]